jgi:tetratricopeptide (TPR) repeat protein
MSKIKYIGLSFALVLPSIAFAQKAERSLLRQGNKQFEKKKFTEAEIKYRKALEINPQSPEGAYNLGNALYKQNKPKETLEFYQAALNKQNDPLKKSQIFHNAGNVSMSAEEYEKAVESYKMSLRLNPNDNETRYNLALAQALLKKQQKENKKKQDKKDDKKEDQEKQQQQQQQDQQKNQNDKKKQEQQQQQQEQVSKEKARQLLDALSQDEKDTQEKVKKLQMQQSKSRKTDKDW